MKKDENCAFVPGLRNQFIDLTTDEDEQSHYQQTGVVVEVVSI